MNYLRPNRRKFCLALGTIIPAVLIACGLSVGQPGHEAAQAAVPPETAPAFSSKESQPVTDAVIPPRLPGMIGAAREIHLEGRDITLQLVDVLSRDSIPAIDDPVFVQAGEAAPLTGGEDFVIGLSLNGEQRAYPTAFLSGHEIVNDVVGGVPVAVTW